jgi:Sulfite oxidase and related enzymes
MYTKKGGRAPAILALCGLLLAVFAFFPAGCSSQKKSLTAGETRATENAQGGQTPQIQPATLSPGPAGGSAESAADAASGASVAADWEVALEGRRKDTLSQAYYQKLKSAGREYLRKTVDKKGISVEYSGLSLGAVLAMVDGSDATHPFSFDADLWAKGYDIVLTAADGYSVSFSTKDIGPQTLILADMEAGDYLAKPMIVGDAPKNLWVKDVVSISTSLAPGLASAEAETFTLELDINGTKASLSLAELEKDPAYGEGTGSYTTSAGTKYTNAYGGVSLSALLGRYMELAAQDSVTFVATDGYEMTYPGSLILDESDGKWLLAFKLDGEYLPKDPGYIRTIKVGPTAPNIDGHSSVKMIKKIVVRQEGFKDFTLSYSGKKDGSLDRSTVQSCVSCHGREVAFERKDIKAKYKGFPLHLLLAYADDPLYAPHKQGSDILAYDAAAARAGYGVEVIAEDGYSIRLDSRDLDNNNDIILAMYRESDSLGPDEFPLVLVWDKNAVRVPEGIKNVKRVSSIRLLF